MSSTAMAKTTLRPARAVEITANWSELARNLPMLLIGLGVIWFAVTFFPQQQRLTPEYMVESATDVGKFLLGLVAFFAIIEIVMYVVLVRILQWRYALAYMLLAPGAIGLAFLFVYPFAYNIAIAFSNRSLQHFLPGTYGYSLEYGINNFTSVFTDKVLHDTGFWEVFFRTWAWTIINVFFHVLGGLGLALLLNRPLALKGIYRTILVFPWAIPQVIACLALRGEFHYEYGFVNNMLVALGLPRVQWLAEPIPAFVAATVSNIWLGIPFMMVIILGGLQSISAEYYEAADMDGASAWQKFSSITWPLLQPVVAPATVLGTIWTFNAFNVIYLITQGGPAEKTDILVTALFKIGRAHV
jgi:arabinogalactan oligomer/maltooligosaccharide transport system permease protein